MSLPGFGAERSFEKSTAKYQGQYVYGELAGGREVPPAAVAGSLEGVPSRSEVQSREVDEPVATMEEAFDVTQETIDLAEKPLSVPLDPPSGIRVEEGEEATALLPGKDLSGEADNGDKLRSDNGT